MWIYFSYFAASKQINTMKHQNDQIITVLVQYISAGLIAISAILVVLYCLYSWCF